MPNVVPFTCCLIILFTMFIDEGNGKWRSKNRQELQKDIAKFKEMAEKIEDEIEDFYDEYSDSWPKDEYFSEEKNSLKTSDSRTPHHIKDNKNTFGFINFIGNTTNNTTANDIPPVRVGTFAGNIAPKIGTMKEIASTEKANIISSKWPKFEDILLEMGKKYDWKNDRWIKVKKKIDMSSEDNHLAAHERHKFSYRTVKLNRSKSRRNVVIAVTAVR